MYTYVHNNPLTNVDPTGHWCTNTVNGTNYAHAGGCNGGKDFLDFKAGINGAKYFSDKEHFMESDLTTVYLINNEDAVGSLGHNAMLFKNSKGEGLILSFGPDASLDASQVKKVIGTGGRQNYHLSHLLMIFSQLEK
ncbi:hypothetical protein [Paenibacillus tyrfis]|uniref:hypothetical protein n=1 Tax=Paenibacillus tyrfis TaxID=1501230 RepID=UPI00209F9C5D|nr:hypothetical protein [Paenibacillus tyrfis]MCP1309669.1 hypothetical protein [Paenibacillus tyrfis]